MLDAKKEQAVISIHLLCLSAEVTHGSNCMSGNNRIAGLFTVLFISNACQNLLQQPKPSIISFIATFFKPKTVQNIIQYHLSIFPRLSAAIIGLAVNKTLGYNANH